MLAKGICCRTNETAFESYTVTTDYKSYWRSPYSFRRRSKFLIFLRLRRQTRLVATRVSVLSSVKSFKHLCIPQRRNVSAKICSGAAGDGGIRYFDVPPNESPTVFLATCSAVQVPVVPVRSALDLFTWADNHNVRTPSSARHIAWLTPRSLTFAETFPLQPLQITPSPPARPSGLPETLYSHSNAAIVPRQFDFS